MSSQLSSERSTCSKHKKAAQQMDRYDIRTWFGLRAERFINTSQRHAAFSCAPHRRPQAELWYARHARRELFAWLILSEPINVVAQDFIARCSMNAALCHITVERLIR